MGLTSDVAAEREALDDLALGRDAFARRAWAAARHHLSSADPATLTPQDWHQLSTAAYLVADRELALRAEQQAFALHSEAGDRLAAATDAYWVASLHAITGTPALADGWVARALRLLEGEPEDVEPRGYLAIPQFFRHLAAGDYASCMECARRAWRIGTRWGNADLVTFGLISQGRMNIYAGRVPEGLAMLDEAMVGLISGEVSPVAAGSTYCAMIEGCQEVSDYQRMTRWTEALNRWCDAQPDLVPFTGQCAVHRAQILRAGGSFAEALDELALAVQRYTDEDANPAIGLALYERGEVLRTLGDVDGAEAAYTAAADHGREPQPGLSLLWLARGRTSTAVASVRRLLGEPAGPVQRARLLPAVVQVLVAGGEGGAARAAAEELVTLADEFGCEALTAEAGYAAGLALLATGEPRAALEPLRRAWKTWIGLGARYDAARARVQIALAFRALGDEESALSELSVAERAFAELGAVPAQREAARLHSVSLPDGLTTREVEVLRLVATGQSNPQVAAALFLSEKTVARHLSNIFTKTGVTSRTAAAAYAHQHNLA
ncbi:MAG TPA: LuxR C-terminal-related transcriptional regulator [Pedococcus sp.]|jgi:DNA-binding NarL/FixJ family response regulator